MMHGAPSASLSTVLRFRLELWLSARTLPLRLHNKSFEQLLAMTPKAGAAPYQGLSAGYVASCVARTVRHPIAMRDRRCLREALLGFEFLRRAGHLPELHFAVDRDSVNEDRISAHCWVCIDGRPVVGRGEAHQVTIYVHKALPEGNA